MLNHKKAFTLVELLVVIAIIGILSAVSVVGIKATRARSRDARRITDINRVDAAIMQYYTVEKTYPPLPTPVVNSTDNYDNLGRLTGFDKYISPLPPDPGSNHYNYNTNGSGFALWAPMESTNNRYAKDTEDGGVNPNYYEVGNGDNWNLLVY